MSRFFNAKSVAVFMEAYSGFALKLPPHVLVAFAVKCRKVMKGQRGSVLCLGVSEQGFGKPMIPHRGVKLFFVKQLYVIANDLTDFI